MKKKKKNTNTQQLPDSGIQDTSTPCPRGYSFNRPGLTAPEKSVTKMFNVENWGQRIMKNKATN